MSNVVPFTGAFITAFAAFGADKDIVSALPLGLFASLVALLVLRLAETPSDFARAK